MAQVERACIAGALIGAAVGAAVGYFYGTDDGAQRRAGLAKFVERATGDVDEARRLWLRLQDVWSEYDRSAPAPRVRAEGGRSWPPSV